MTGRQQAGYERLAAAPIRPDVSRPPGTAECADPAPEVLVQTRLGTPAGPGRAGIHGRTPACQAIPEMTATDHSDTAGPEIRLAAYGTLAPGRQNNGQLSNLSGRWLVGHVRGTLVEAGWGATLGYPGLILEPDGAPIQVFVFESRALVDHWERLDAFEGPGYRRIAVEVSTDEVLCPLRSTSYRTRRPVVTPDKQHGRARSVSCFRWSLSHNAGGRPIVVTGHNAANASTCRRSPGRQCRRASRSYTPPSRSTTTTSKEKMSPAPRQHRDVSLVRARHSDFPSTGVRYSDVLCKMRACWWGWPVVSGAGWLRQ